MSRHRRLHSKPSRTTICAAAGTAAAASVAAAVIAAGPTLFQPAAASGAGSPGASSGLALAVGRVADQQRAQRPAAVTGPAHPENPALAARQALNKRYAQAVAARKRATAARLAAERARKAAQQQAAGSGAQPAGSPQQIALAMLPSFGWSSSEFNCLNPLWQQESGWNPYASNPSSGAYGIPQALPGSKMASAGPDWQSNAATQIRWGLDYIRATYGSPCSAWSHEQATGWY